MAHRLLRHVPLVGGILGLLMLPQVASAQLITAPPGGVNPEIPPVQAEKAAAPVNGITLGAGRFDPSRHITVNITDSGFEKQDYTVSTSLGLNSKSDQGTIVFQNNGTMVHTATMIPGSGYLRVYQDNYVSCSARTCSAGGTLDTGGIAPGQAVVVTLQYLGSGDFTSATDCLNGNSTPGFNCAPVHLTIKATPISNILNSSMEGTVHRMPDGTLDTKRTFNSSQGSASKPLTGNVTINIDDENGYDPSTVFISAGTDVTWVNKGNNTHSVRCRTPGTCAPDWVHPLDSGGLVSGDSYTYHYDCSPDPGCRNMGGFTSKFISNIIDDIIQPNQNGSTNSNGNDSRFVGRIVVVPLPK